MARYNQQQSDQRSRESTPCLFDEESMQEASSAWGHRCRRCLGLWSDESLRLGKTGLLTGRRGPLRLRDLGQPGCFQRSGLERLQIQDEVCQFLIAYHFVEPIGHQRFSPRAISAMLARGNTIKLVDSPERTISSGRSRSASPRRVGHPR